MGQLYELVNDLLTYALRQLIKSQSEHTGLKPDKEIVDDDRFRTPGLKYLKVCTIAHKGQLVNRLACLLKKLIERLAQLLDA